MKIYFNAAVSARSSFDPTYRRIVKVLEDLGHTVLADHVLNYDMQTLLKQTPEERRAYYYQMKMRIKNADMMVAEVSFPSTVHVGHELTLALEYNKPVLALHRKENRPVLFWGLDMEKFCVAEYNDHDLEEVIKSCIKFLSEQQDTRFNFFISPKHQSYLDSIVKKKKIPRAVYLRQLIDEDMRKHEGEL